METSAGLPLLLALGARIVLNTLYPGHATLAPTHEYILTGIFEGALLYTVLYSFSVLSIPVGAGIAAKLLLDYFRTFDTTQSICTLSGIALGTIFSDALSRAFEGDTITTVTTRERVTTHARAAHEPSKRIRLVSFERDRTRTHRNHHDAADDGQQPQPAPPRAPTSAQTHASTAPSISLDSVPSSIDPEGRMTPRERAVAVLRARASLADSERRRFKEERKWALSQGNFARANQLAWQVKRYTTLMESFHREADAMVVEAARVASGTQSELLVERTRRTSQTQRRQAGQSTVPFPGQSTTPAPAEQAPLVSVTVGTSRSRRRSSGTIRPAIHVQGREVSTKR
ncbi:hypothetical protein WOLCODRAFT_153838 [Wolfiporia cocos MD-104 SS10]|uniref:Uncharacterized protein n=1 Tax=Wolfiporia cocos (strain MD-104) TaxID=742152 RepID=A0A2H3JXZ7_WOLCO|nr:hypothetical protein WOLCODRAFT_153838 [Wolfiporia cocos MD-104 SS10]